MFDNSIWVTILEIANIVISIILMCIFFFQGVHMIVALFTKKKTYKEASKNHKYGYIICARNEEKVIANLVESIYSQDYPKELMRVFVCADNCTDNTANAAREANAIVIEHFDNVHKGKCYALDYIIKEILNNKEYDDIEAFFVFDADNLVSKNYTKEMNKLFDSNINVATSFRSTKNYNDSMTAACSGLMFLRENVITHHSRARLGLSTYVAGTGFYVSRDILTSLNGWPFTSIIEDIDFSSYCAKENIKIGYSEDAVFYDEQPLKFKDANTQHLRWIKGTYQCGSKYSKALLKNAFNFKLKLSERISSYEMNVHISPMIIVGTTWMILYHLIHLIFFLNHVESTYYYTHVTLLIGGSMLIATIFLGILNGALPLIKYGKTLKGSFIFKFLSAIIFPLYMITYLPIYYIALFKKQVKWVPIEHNNTTKIDDLNK